jgi:hypothetical protein
LIELYVGADDKNSSINILQVRFHEKKLDMSFPEFILCIIQKVKKVK